MEQNIYLLFHSPLHSKYHKNRLYYIFYDTTKSFFCTVIFGSKGIAFTPKQYILILYFSEYQRISVLKRRKAKGKVEDHEEKETYSIELMYGIAASVY